MRAELLSAWSKIATIEGYNDWYFVEFEKYLYKIGIRSKVEFDEANGQTVLFVPSKDFEWANALYHGEVADIITGKGDMYYMFDENQHLKNQALVENMNKKKKCKTCKRAFISGLVAIALIFLFSILKTIQLRGF